eukprot:scaffold3025_cov132-Isochrysis_galbana.AAC.7
MTERDARHPPNAQRIARDCRSPTQVNAPVKRAARYAACATEQPPPASNTSRSRQAPIRLGQSSGCVAVKLLAPHVAVQCGLPPPARMPHRQPPSAWWRRVPVSCCRA